MYFSSLTRIVGGDRRAGAWEKRGGRQEKRGWEAGVPRWLEPGEIEKISQYFAKEMAQKGGNHYKKWQEVGVKGTGSGSRRYGKQEFQTPVSLHRIVSKIFCASLVACEIVLHMLHL